MAVTSRLFSGLTKRIKDKFALQHAIRSTGVTSELRAERICLAETINELKAANISLISDQLDDDAVAKFSAQADYEFYYPWYYQDRALVRLKKIREHYMAARLLDLQKHDIYLDVASQHSPAPAVYERLFGCQVFRQDLEYPPGRNGRVLGGPAGKMALDDNSITKMAMHCSLEHFEGDEDIAFIKEAHRVLVMGGKLVIVPLYLSDEYFVMTQPSLWANLPRNQWPLFPRDATIYRSCGNRHERYYDVRHFLERLTKHGKWGVTLYSFGDTEIYEPGQMRLAAVLKKI